MSNEEHLEEVLHEAHKLGIVKDIMEGLKCTDICKFRDEVIKKFNEIKEKKEK